MEEANSKIEISDFSSTLLNKKTLRSKKINLEKEIINQENEKKLNTSNSKEPIMSNIKKNNEQNSSSFRIIEPYRTLGLVINEKKPVYFMRGVDRFLLASNGNSFLLYNLEKIRIERISPPMNKNISALGVYKNKILTGINNKVQLWDKIHIIKEYGETIDNSQINVTQILTFDDILLFANNLGYLYIYKIFSCELISKLNLRIEIFIHPLAHFNRILYTTIPEKYELDLNFKGCTPNLILYNINTEKEIYNFKNDNLFPQSKINIIEQSPKIDIIGISFNSGDIVLFDIKISKRILSLFSHDLVTSMSFSTCVNMSKPLLATGTINGNINLWDLNSKSIYFTISNHFNQIDNLIFLPNEPLLLSTSERDNSIKMFRFDNSNSLPSLLKMRGGHKFPPQKIRFYGENTNIESNNILSYDNTALRNISIINEHMSKEFSLKKFNDILFKNNDLNRKIIDYDFNEFRERDWGNICLVYENFEYPLILSYENGSICEIQPSLKTKNSKCLCVTVSMCGNFGFCGFDNGTIEKFNMQSGQSRWVINKAHDNHPVANLKCDSINSMLISISKEEKCVKFWDIFQHSLIKKFDIENYPYQIEINKDNDLVGVSLVNNKILVLDKSQIKIVREFNTIIYDENKEKDEKYLINDFVFSKDAKWLLIVYGKYVKIFDILSTNLIEWVYFDKIPLSICISPNNQYIALSFENDKGIYLYVNRTLFIDFEDIEEIKYPIHCDLSFVKAKVIKNRSHFNIITEDESKKNKINNNNDNNLDIIVSKENEKLLTLSNENILKYRIINNIENIQERNKPVITNKTKEKAPFFLFNLDDVLEGKLPPKQSKKNLINEQNNSPEFLRLLKNYSHFKNEKTLNEKFESKKINETDLILTKILKAFSEHKIKSFEVTVFLNKLNPYFVDLEIRSIDPMIIIDKENYLDIFLDYLLEEFKNSNSNYEMIQAYLNRFIKLYNDDIINDKNLKEKLNEINELNSNKFKELDEMYKNTMCLISYFGQIQL